MFKHRYGFIFLILIILALTLPFASASDENTTLGSDDSSQVLTDQINISSGDFSDLRSAVYGANEGDVISIEGEYVRDKYSISIEDPITIQSASSRAVINGNGTYESFYIKSNDVVFKNLDFINSGTASLDILNGSVTIINCSFIDCRAVKFDEGSISIINSTFINSNIDYYSLGSYQDITILNSRFYGCEFLNFMGNDAADVDVENSVFINSTGNLLYFDCRDFLCLNNTFINVNGSALSVVSSRATISKNTFRNIANRFDVEAVNLTFSDNSFKNVSRDTAVKSDTIQFLNDTFDDIELFGMQANRTDFINTRFDGFTQVSLRYSSVVNVINSTFEASSAFRVYECENVTISDSRFGENSCFERIYGLENCWISNCEISTENKAFYIVSQNMALKDTSFLNFNATVKGWDHFEVSGCEFINSYWFSCGDNTIIRNTRFINSTENDYAFIVGSSQGELFSMDNCTFINVSRILINPIHETVMITNSTFRNVGGDDNIIESRAKNMTITGNEFDISSNSKVLFWASQYEFREVDLRITNNIFAYTNPIAPIFQISPITDFENDYDEYLVQENILLKDNFYGYNMQTEEQVKRLAFFGHYIKNSWVNVKFEDMANGTYQLKFTDNNGNVAALRDYTFSIIDKNTGDIIKSDILVKDGVGEFKLDKNITLDDLYIINAAGSRVNRPNATISILKKGSTFEDIKIIFKICDENGNPIPYADFTAYIYCDRTYQGVKRDDVYISLTDANGECVLDYEWYPDDTIYDIVLTFTDLRHALTTTTMSDMKIIKSEAVITAKDFTTSYNSKKMPVIKAVSKNTKKSVGGIEGRINVYKGSKLIDYEDFEIFSVVTDFYGVLNLKPGTYKAVIVPDNRYSYYTAEKVTFKITIKKLNAKVKAPKVTAKFKKSKYFKITVKYNKKPLKNIKVKIKVYTGKKSKTYTVKTDKKGIAKLNTKKLKKGKHNVAVSSASDIYSFSAKSKITIK